MRKVIELQLLQSSLNAGWIYPVDVVTDPKCFRQSSGGDGFLIPLKAGRQVGEIQRIEPVSIPQSLMELSASLADDITKISGVNEELLGAATDDRIWNSINVTTRSRSCHFADDLRQIGLLPAFIWKNRTSSDTKELQQG